MPQRIPGARRRQEPQPEPFERSEAEWRALGAPADLYDKAAAADRWRAIAPAGYRLDGLEEFASGPVRHLLAARWWTHARPAFLAAHGALTAREAYLMERFPNYYAPPRWRSGATPWRRA